MAHFILVHGAWHGAWCWDTIVPLLREQGHTVTAFDLAGLGEDTTPAADVTLKMWLDQLAEAILASPAKPIVVGHSRGGLILGEAAERHPERIEGLIYLSAMLAASGVSANDFLSAYHASRTAEPLQISPTADGAGLEIGAESLIARLYQRCSSAAQQYAIAKIRPEPIAPLLEKTHLTDSRFGLVKRAFIECSEDKCFDLALQREMQVVFPCNPVVTLNADHSPFHSAPVELVDALNEIAGFWASK